MSVEAAKRSVFEYLVINYRWVLVCFFLFPLSLAYDSYYYIRSKIIFKLKSAPKKHDEKVKFVQKQIRDWKNSGSQVPMCTSRPGWQTMNLGISKLKKSLHNIHIDLVDILELNIEKQFVRAEPKVTMGQITAILCPLGWTIAMVPELEDLTVGGMSNGTGVESSSHIYGLWDHICLAHEVVLPDGSLVRCSKDENSDLFYAIPFSHGTIGFVVATEVKIVPCKQFVKIEYIPLYKADDICKRMSEESKKSNPVDFVETLMYTKNTGVLMLGQMTNETEPEKVNKIGKFYKPWFYKHVETFLKSGQQSVEYIPLRDYYHRHTRSLFWEMEDIVPFGNWTVFRYLFGWIMPPKVSFLKLTQGETLRKLYEKHQFIQDFLIPINRLREYIDFADENVKVYPIWVCPFRVYQQPGMVHQTTDEDMYVDFGLYGVPKVANYEASKTIRKVEAYTRKIKGYQMMYTYTYMTESEFREMYDHTLYDKVRNQYNAEKAFPRVYNKICKQAMY